MKNKDFHINDYGINYNAKHHCSSNKCKKTILNSACAVSALALLVTGVTMSVNHVLSVKPDNSQVYASALPHHVYSETVNNLESGQVAGFDDHDEQDIMTVARQISDINLQVHIPFIENNLSENLEISETISVDPELVESSEHTSNIDDSKPFVVSPGSITKYTVRSGDSLAKILTFLGFDDDEVNHFVVNDEIRKLFANIKPGQHVEILTDDDNQISELRYNYSLLETYQAKKEDDRWITQTLINDHTIETIKVAGVINNSLDVDATKSGIDKSLVSKLKTIFKSQINFNRDIQKGDSFAVIYEYLYINGKPYKPSNLIAAEINVRGKRFTAIRHNNEDKSQAEYYDIDGKSLNVVETFLRHPIESPRITSKFGTRVHPVLKRKKMHNGVDYGARRGTPIIAPANGKVEHAGRKGSYGNVVIIQHANGIKTLYAHMKGFAKNVRSGTHVKKGEVIGYVGSTGRSTGPHLHYEMFKGGQLVNPLTTDLPVENTIPESERARFIASANILSGQLELMNNERIAQAEAVEGSSVSR